MVKVNAMRPVFLCLAIISALFPFLSAHAGERDHRLTYQVYAGGFHAVEARFDYSLTSKNYDLFVEATTTGFLHSLVPWTGSFATKGWVLGDGMLRPEEHRSIALWRDDRDEKIYHYAKDGRFKDLVIRENDVDRSPETLDADVVQNSTDILSATFTMLRDALKTDQCAGRSEIFDGKRRFELTYQDQGEATLNQSNHAMFNGPARRCTVMVKPVAGDWGKKPRGWLNIQEQGRKRGQLPTVWIAPLDALGGAYAPVRIEVKTSYGTLLMHLTHVE